MTDSEKVNKLLSTSRDPQEIQDWLFSLAPLGVAFTFFIVFMWQLDIPHKNNIIVIGVAAGFIGLESYWIARGWRKNHILTVILGGIGIALTFALTFMYFAFS